MAQWFWMKGGQKQGPVDTAELKRLAQIGQLLPTDMIWREGMANWVSAANAKGLFVDTKDQSMRVEPPRAIPPPPVPCTGPGAPFHDIFSHFWHDLVGDCPRCEDFFCPTCDGYQVGEPFFANAKMHRWLIILTLLSCYPGVIFWFSARFRLRCVKCKRSTQAPVSKQNPNRRTVLPSWRLRDWLWMLFSFRGRLDRVRYTLSMLAIWCPLIAIYLNAIDKESIDTMLLFVACSIAALVMEYPLWVKRFHDLGRPGTHILLFFVPIYDVYVLLELVFRAGSESQNQYGPAPETIR